MKVVFKLDDGRTVEVPAEQLTLTSPNPNLNLTVLAVPLPNGQMFPMINFPCVIAVPQNQTKVSELRQQSKDDSVEWCEDLWKLEDDRENR